MRQHQPRLKEIHRLRGRLERDGYPRLQMLLLVSITGAAGFLASYALLQAGFSEMWLRYLFAFGLAYAVFLLLLWVWLKTNAKDYGEIPNVIDFMPTPSRGGYSPHFSGKDGEFGGGGASGSFDHPIGPPHLDDLSSPFDTESASGALDVVSGADELAIPLIALALVVGLLLSSLFVVYSAPILFAELLFDGVLAAGLYRRLRGLERRHWLESAVRRTFWPFMLTAVFIVAAGWGMERFAPGAQSIGDVMRPAKTVR